MTWLVQTYKGGAKRRGKAERRKRTVRPLIRFVNYGLMFDLRRSFSLGYNLIRSPY